VQQKTLNLSQTEIFVMDEADRMLDMGFLPDLQRIINLLPKQRQNLMFSATFSPEIKKLANSFLQQPVLIEVARSNATAERVTQEVFQVEEDAKSDAVIHLLRSREIRQVIVFSNTKIGASRLARELEKQGINATAIHGDKTQGERMAALEAFKSGGLDVLVATDVAARGLDIAELPCVINYDLPYNAEDYVHRIGRTGRAGASGEAISLYSEKDARFLADIEKLIKQKLTPKPLEGLVTQRSNSSRPSESGDRSRPERSDRSGRGEHADRSSARSEDRRPAERSGVARSYASPRKEKVDPWFFKPYEPATIVATVAAPSESQLAKNAQPVKRAALLGGVRKDSAS
jgi:superfamily II DNA/RNA helicase